MLSLSERCPALKDLNISAVKKVSDVGLRYLSQGCRQLEILDATGCFLITDGKTRDFGLEGIQALCKVSPSLKSLKLAGCYNVGAIALASIGFGCRKLEFINLSSCPRVNAAGLGSLTKGCNLLTNICLRGCDKVEDDSLRAIARNAPQLLTINLSDIEGISDSGVAALVRGCKALQFITLKHCKGVSDLSLLAIAEANMNPGIRDLNLLGCYEVTDTGVSWLAERCPTIVCLNVLVRVLSGCAHFLSLKHCEPLHLSVLCTQGCTVSRPGLRAMLHAWKHVSLRDDEHWLGPWPAERARELKFIEDFGDQWKAAQKFQVRRVGVALRASDTVFLRVLCAPWLPPPRPMLSLLFFSCLSCSRALCAGAVRVSSPLRCVWRI